MSTVVLNPAQEACLDRGGLVTVEAGAGSGKTRVLIQRFLRLLGFGAAPDARVYDLDEIVAITFTRKAAAELKHRLHGALVALADGGDETAKGLVERVRFAQVSTIDGFFSRLLREFPLEAGVDPGFRVLAETERAWVAEEARAEVFREISTGPPDTPGYRDLDLALEAAGTRRRLEQCLDNLAADRAATAALAAEEPAELAARWAALHAADTEAIFAALRDDPAVKEAAEEAEALLATAAKPDSLTRLLDEVLAGLRAGTDAGLDAARKAMTNKKGEAIGFGRLGSKPAFGTNVARAREIGGALAAALAAADPPPPELDQDIEDETAAVAVALARLATRVAEARRARLSRLGALDFEDVIEGVERLFSGPHAPRVLAALRARYPVFLLDEMQDTNPRQWHLLSPLVLPEAPEAPPGESFLVGDPKQAIYAFRRADVRVFLRAVAEMADANQAAGRPAMARVLDRSYRADPGLIAFVNALFAPLMAAPDSGFGVNFQALEANPERDGGASLVEAHLIHASKETSAADAQAAEAKVVAERVAAVLAEGTPPAEVAVLLRRRQVLPGLTRALDDAGVPYRVSGGIGFFQRQEVRDALAVLTHLAHPGDDLALAATLRSPLLGLSDEDLLYLRLFDPRRPLVSALEAITAGATEWPEDSPPAPPACRARLVTARQTLAGWRALADRLPPAATLDRVATEAGLWGVYAARADGGATAANLEKVLGLIRGVPGDLAEVTRFLRRQVDREQREGDANPEAAVAGAVQLMTVHASKGLEFDVVVVPDLGRQLQGASPSPVIADPDGGWAFAPPDWRREDDDPETYARRRANARLKAQARAEEKRLFYVACTRARHRLILSGHADLSKEPSGGRWVDWLRAGVAPLAEASPEPQDAQETTWEGAPLRWWVHGIESAGEPEAKDEESLSVSTTFDSEPSPEATTRPPPPPDPAALAAELAEARGARTRRPAQAPPATLSPTRVADYRCPRYYAYRHELGIDPARSSTLLTPPGAETVRTNATGPGGAAVGEATHSALEAWLQSPDTEPEVAIENGIARWRARAADLRGPRQDAAADTARALAQGFMKDPFAARLRAARSLRVEVPFSMVLRRTTLIGAIDVLYHDAEEGWVVLDWKTTKPPTEGATTAWVDETAARFTPQLLAYAASVHARRPDLAGVTISVYFLRAAKRWKRKVSSEDLDAYLREVDEVAAGISMRRYRRGDASQQVTAETCAGCSFSAICPEAIARIEKPNAAKHAFSESGAV